MSNLDMLVDQLTAKTQPTIVQISTDKLHPFPARPFKVQDDEDMEQLTQSIQMQGVLTPLVIRPLKNGEYEVISGHRRLHACRKAGIHTVPALVYATPCARWPRPCPLHWSRAADAAPAGYI